MKFAATAVVAASFLAGLSLGNVPITPERAEADISKNELQNVLWHFQKIARDNGGNRAHGLPGYKASVDFILERVVKRFGARLDTYVQPFNATFNQVKKIELTGPAGESVEVYALQFVQQTPSDGASGDLIDTPVDDQRGSGCFEDQWAGIDAAGKIPLIKRGICALSTKLKLAKERGAVAAVIYNNEPGTPGGATLGSGNFGQLVPVGLVRQDVGLDWKKRLAAGDQLRVKLLVDAIFEQRESWNIVSETKLGDPNNVVMLGAHLDSVQAGPGVNDDGSGSAALLEIVTSFQKYVGYKNKVRFAWWGAEELGLLGSLHYTAQLPEAERDKIKFYFNYDMIGSIEPVYLVQSDTVAHKYGGQPLFDYLVRNGVTPRYSKFGSSSDYYGFLQIGIPSAGIFTGAGAPNDPCYHQACDNLTNIHWDAFQLNAKAAAYVAAKLALNLDGVPLRNKTSVNPASRRGVQNGLADLAAAVEVAENHASCSGELNTF
ncbi:hypothetical protein NLG97_g3514 [Lecanicillium saksenae]|uniref:Uncharacterized protein n=1 Tax=Lecanicillium saksenae TaxID=468837 RepID=A0ACC1QXZ3_9HYPO|nr:hypothetical protein NLG97_g3514 [Lecanicillium saksenae]